MGRRCGFMVVRHSTGSTEGEGEKTVVKEEKKKSESALRSAGGDGATKRARTDYQRSLSRLLFLFVRRGFGSTR